MLTNDDINKLIGIDESFKAPYKLKGILKNKDQREKLFDSFLEKEADLTFDWFTDYFQEEHSDRKNKKQDFTPDSVAAIASKILGESNSSADICAGTGGLTIKRYNANPSAKFYCEEFSDRAIPFLLFNLAIRNLNAVVFHGDSLTRKAKTIYKLKKTKKYSDIEVVDSLRQEQVETVISNPPYSLSWNPVKEMLNESRFKEFDALAPKNKADYAFLLQGLSLLNETGTMTAILPHGVLFRGGAEEKIRKRLIELNLLDTVIGLPEKLFLATDIPTVILVFKKQRQNKNILFIDASKLFKKDKNHNSMLTAHVDKVLETYRNRFPADKLASIVDLNEIAENDYNLNIPRYVDTFDPEPPIDLKKTAKELVEIDDEIARSNRKLLAMMSQLVGTNPTANKELKDTVKILSRKGNRKSNRIPEGQMSLL